MYLKNINRYATHTSNYYGVFNCGLNCTLVSEIIQYFIFLFSPLFRKYTRTFVIVVVRSILVHHISSQSSVSPKSQIFFHSFWINFLLLCTLFQCEQLSARTAWPHLFNRPRVVFLRVFIAAANTVESRWVNAVCRGRRKCVFLNNTLSLASAATVAVLYLSASAQKGTTTHCFCFFFRRFVRF